MTVRHALLALAALAVLLGGAGCGAGGDLPVLAEADEPYYAQGMMLKKQGRHGEALNAFMKAIDKRGERGAAESHFEAGLIYLNDMKDPVRAYYHFDRYLDLHPNSTQAPLVRGQREAARREFARSLPARPLEDQSVRLAADEETVKLRRENEEMRAELLTLRGGVAAQPRTVVRPIVLPPFEQPRTAPPAAVPVIGVAADDGAVSPVQPAPAPAPRLAGTVAPKAAAAPVSAPPPRGGRTHVVQPKETTFGIAKKYGVRMEELYEANRDAMRSVTDLRPGMTLRIPGGAAPAGARR